jgi:hypothetical protein
MVAHASQQLASHSQRIAVRAKVMCGPAPEQLDRAAQREIRELREQPGRSRRIDRGPQRTSCLSDTNQQVRAHVRVYAPFKRDRWLLVYDNAEGPRELAPYRPPGGPGRR